MSDKEFLYWIHQRLVNVYKENLNMDYMHKLRNIIEGYDPDKYTSVDKWFDFTYSRPGDNLMDELEEGNE